MLAKSFNVRNVALTGFLRKKSPSFHTPVVRSFSSNTTILDPFSVTAKAYFLAQNIDILKVDTNVYASSRRAIQSKHITIHIDPVLNQYIAVFKFGSIVFFNIPENQHIEHINSIREKVGIYKLEGPAHTEDYRIVINENLEKPSIIKAENVNIQKLDSNNITIISTVMAQSVAIDYYASVVENMLQEFMLINSNIERGNNFKELPGHLYQMIARNNMVITTILSKLGIFEGSDAAWDNADYCSTWESLRKDFEIEFRYRDLEMKIDIIKEDTRFFLEMLHNQKTSKMEWAIIILISMELCSSIFFHLQPN